jgi:hypothetical protein
VTTGGREFLQQATHAELIKPALPSVAARHADAGPDAIIVPAARDADNLESAIKLAVDADCHLVVLCSREAEPSSVNLLLRECGIRGDEATVVNVPAGYRHDLFRFDTTRWVRNAPGYQTRAARDHDLSVKRNIGLALAHMLGWQRIFFMDDDIRDVTADALAALTGLLDTNGPAGPYRIAGMTVREFPDNSVVCHARRDVKKDQDVFVSGSVLAVDCTVPFGFFPDIYNEDWLFFYDDTALKRLGTLGFNVRQLEYAPFADPQRATRQEFGDVIAEGLYSLLHRGRGWQDATREYWRQFLGDRRRILDEITGRLHLAPEEMRDEMARAIEAASKTQKAIHPGMCVKYVETWREDLRCWHKRLEDLPQCDSAADALRELGLSPADHAL